MTQGATVLARPKNKEMPEALSILAILGNVKAIRPYLGLIIGLALVLTIYLLRAQLVAFVDHDIEKVSVKGELRHLGRTEVSGVVAPWLGSSFLMADLEGIKSKTLDLPWANSVTVSRKWPAEIVIHVTEQVPVTQWGENAYLNANGEVFKPASLVWTAPLIGLVGPEDSSLVVRQGMLAQVQAVQQLLNEHSELTMRALEFKARGVWAMTLDDGIRVDLGRPPFDIAIERLVTVLGGAASETRARIEAVDTRYPNGLAIKWASPDQLEGAEP